MVVGSLVAPEEYAGSSRLTQKWSSPANRIGFEMTTSSRTAAKWLVPTSCGLQESIPATNILRRHRDGASAFVMASATRERSGEREEGRAHRVGPFHLQNHS